jgi:hypothetical protein
MPGNFAAAPASFPQPVKSSKNYLLVILACTTIGGAAYAWKQYQELIQLRAAALGTDERSELQKKLWAAEKRAKELADQLAARRNGGGGDEALAEGGDAADPENANRADRRNRGPGGPGGRGGDIMAALQKPEIQRLLATQQKAALDARYAGLFKSLNLTPAQLDKFKNLLVERQTSMMDVMAAARGQGLNREDMQKLVASTQAEIDASIKSAIGDAAFSQYKNYDQTAAQRATTDQLSQRLSYSGAPLTAEQSAAMTQILSQTVPARTANGTSGAAVTVVAEAGGRGGFGMNFIAGAGAGMGGPSSPITDATITMAQGVLSAPQVEALKQLQAEQQAQQKIAEAMRQTMGGGNNTRTPATTTTTKKKGD